MNDKMIVTMTEAELKLLVRQCVSEGIEYALHQLQPTAAPGEKNLLTKQEAAQLLSCSPATIDNLARSGKIERHYVSKRAVRFDREQVMSQAKKVTYYKSKQF